MRIVLTIALALFVSTASTQVLAARPPSPKRTASALINEGNKLMRKRDYRAALARYRAAHELYPTPKIFFNMAEASIELGELVQAAEYYERFIAESGVRKRSKLRRAAKRRLKRLGKKLSTVDVSQRAVGATVFIDGTKVGTAPLSGHRVLAGTHEVVLDKAGYLTRTIQLECPAGEHAAVDVALEVRAPPPPPVAVTPPAPPPPPPPIVSAPVEPEVDEPVTSKWWFWTAVVGAVAAGGVATALVVTRSDDFALDGDLGVSSTAEWERQ
ncbi:MAG: PEGA domain-containing protein [Deltaproteobacteria bacterium]